MSASAAGPATQPGGGPLDASWSEWPAPAKLNLFLRLTGRRPDGYHTLQTAFRLLDWGDAIRLRLRSDGKILSHGPWAATIDEAEDLTICAANMLAKESKTALGADIFVEKHIPLGAGLGGGSSDAGTTLLALNRLWGTNLPLDHLAALGLQLGADVPLFVHGHNAWAEGVGEQLTRIELAPAWYLLVDPGVHVATAELFQAPELTRDAVPATMSDFVSDALNGDAAIGSAALGNAFEPVLRRREPAIEAAFVALAQVGAPRLTGSGGTCFVEFAERGSAHAALASLPQGLNAWIAQGAACSPMLQALQTQGRRQEAQGTRF